MAASTFGICVGSENAIIALSKDGKVNVLANDLGERCTPSVVCFQDSGEILVGRSAKHLIGRISTGIIQNVIAILGENFESEGVEKFRRKNPDMKVVNHDGKAAIEVKLEEKTLKLTPDEVVKHIFDYLYQIARHYSENDKFNCVIGLPKSTSDTKRHRIKQAATKSGFTVLRVLSSMAAALLSHNIGQDDPYSRFFVVCIEMGASKFVLSLVEVTGGMYRLLLQEEHSDRCDGERLTDAVVEAMAADFRRQGGGDPLQAKRAKAKLREAAENSKHVLSTMDSAPLAIEALVDGRDLNLRLTRSRFEIICSDLFAAFGEVLNQFVNGIKEKGVTIGDVTHVVLAGAAMKTPKLQGLVRDCFPSATMCGALAPEETAVQGCALQAALLSTLPVDDDPPRHLLCIPCGLRVSLEGHGAQTLLPLHMPLPARRDLRYRPEKWLDGGRLLIEALTTESAVKVLEVPIETMTTEQELLVHIELDENGTLQVSSDSFLAENREHSIQLFQPVMS